MLRFDLPFDLAATFYMREEPFSGFAERLTELNNVKKTEAGLTSARGVEKEGPAKVIERRTGQSRGADVVIL